MARAGKVSVEAINSNINDLRRMLEKAQVEYDSTGDRFSDEDVFKERLGGFLTNATQDSNLCMSLHQEFQNTFRSTARYFCESETTKAADFFGLFYRFRVSYLKSLEQVSAMQLSTGAGVALSGGTSSNAADSGDPGVKRQMPTGVDARMASKAADIEAVGNLLASVQVRR